MDWTTGISLRNTVLPDQIPECSRAQVRNVHEFDKMLMIAKFWSKNDNPPTIVVLKEGK